MILRQSYDCVRTWQGSPLVGDATFSLEVMKSMFQTLGNINFCPCRPVDFERMGDAPTLHTLYVYVSQDLTYLKVRCPLRRKQAQCRLSNPSVATNSVLSVTILKQPEVALACWRDSHSLTCCSCHVIH